MGPHMTTNGRRSAGRRVRRLCCLMTVAALSLGTALSFPFSRPASAASNGLWSVFPTTLPGQAPREFFHPVLQPGKAYKDTVAVANYTAAPLTFNLYAADAFNTSGDGLSLRRRTDIQTDIGKWISLPYDELTVPARSETFVPFTILPPPQASPGDHVGGIVAEQTQGTTSHSGSTPITVVQAVGVRVYGRVVGPLHPKLAIRGMLLSAGASAAAVFGAGVSARVTFTITNSGNTVLSPMATVELSTPFGTAARRSLPINQLLPGNSLKYAWGFPGVSAYGHLKAQVTVTAMGAEAVGSASAWVLPWGLIVIVVVALSLVGLLLWRRHRRDHPLPSPVHVGDSSGADAPASHSGDLVGAAGDRHAATGEAAEKPQDPVDRG